MRHDFGRYQVGAGCVNGTRSYLGNLQIAEACLEAQEMRFTGADEFARNIAPVIRAQWAEGVTTLRGIARGRVEQHVEMRGTGGLASQPASVQATGVVANGEWRSIGEICHSAVTLDRSDCRTGQMNWHRRSLRCWLVCFSQFQCPFRRR